MSDNIEKVTGIGGIFFRVRDPAKMSAWYREHLGICAEDGHADFVWREHKQPDEIGRTVWSLFPADTDYFGPTRPAFMINYRVSNLERMAVAEYDGKWKDFTSGKKLTSAVLSFWQ